MKIIHTDNFGGDYPDEKFVEGLPPTMTEGQAIAICRAINDVENEIHGFAGGPRFWRVVPDDYKLRPGFEP